MLTAFGNHDWRARDGTGNPWGDGTELPRDEEADYINKWSNEFTRLSYEKSQERTKGKLEYQEIPPTGRLGQSMYKATYAGIQIVNFNAAFNWQSYDNEGVYSADDQFQRLSASLDRSLPTIFFSHYPLTGVLPGQSPSVSDVTALIGEFGEGSHHFSGHYHVERIFPYVDSISGTSFNDYVAPYPHSWFGKFCSTSLRVDIFLDDNSLLTTPIDTRKGTWIPCRFDVPYTRCLASKVAPHSWFGRL